MIVQKTKLDDVYLIQPKVFNDKRGHFFESFNQQKFQETIGEKVNFVQDNQSCSNKGVLRGMHFQKPPYAQGKLVRVIKGSVIDVAIDIRKNSPTYGKYIMEELNEKNHSMLFLPEGIAHGFITLEDHTIFTYKCTNYYNKDAEGSIIWNDANLNIQWPNINPVISEKDQIAKKFSSFASPF